MMAERRMLCDFDVVLLMLIALLLLLPRSTVSIELRWLATD
jgi:hypothetical protein